MLTVCFPTSTFEVCQCQLNGDRAWKVVLTSTINCTFFFIQVWLPLKITLVVPDSQIMLLPHQTSRIDLELVGQQTRGFALHQEWIGRSMEVTVPIQAIKYVHVVNKPLSAAGISKDNALGRIVNQFFICLSLASAKSAFWFSLTN